MSTKNPNRDKAKELWLSSGKTRLLKDIAADLGEPEGKIRKWKSIDCWDKECSTKKSGTKKSNNKGNVPPKKGAPKGNKNAAGNSGGAPEGNQNNLKHGGYSQIYWDTLDDTEKELIETLSNDEEIQLIEQIKLFAVRERRIMKAIKQMKEQASGIVERCEQSQIGNVPASQVVSAMSHTITGRVGKGEDGNIKMLLGGNLTENVITESVDNVIQRLEAELTKVQRAKTRAIEALARFRLEKEKLDMLKNNDNVEIEDTNETDGMIYGKDIS